MGQKLDYTLLGTLLAAIVGGIKGFELGSSLLVEPEVDCFDPRDLGAFMILLTLLIVAPGMVLVAIIHVPLLLLVVGTAALLAMFSVSLLSG
jgi:hypothetical protein